MERPSPTRSTTWSRSTTSPSFSYPLTLTTSPITFGTRFEAGWGNAIQRLLPRPRRLGGQRTQPAVEHGQRSRSPTLRQCRPRRSLVSPAAGATVTVPVTFDWTDTANPQVPGYQLDVDTDPSFSGSFGVLLVQGVARSDYMVASDLPPGNYFWRVRGAAWRGLRAVDGGTRDQGCRRTRRRPSRDYSRSSPSRAPPTAAIRRKRGCCSTHQRRRAGESSTSRATCRKRKCRRRRVFIPAGKTDAMVTPITTGPVPTNGIVGTIRAAYAGEWEQNSLGVLSIPLWHVAQQPECRRWRAVHRAR